MINKWTSETQHYIDEKVYMDVRVCSLNDGMDLDERHRMEEHIYYLLNIFF